MDINKLFQQVRDIFTKMSPIQRTNFFLLVGIVLVFVGMLVMWAGKENYTILYSRLSSKDAAEIKAKLDEMKVPNKVEDTAIYVDAKQVHEARLALANEGLPQGSGVGYEIFGKPGLVMTDYMQNITYKRALEGELARTISTMAGVRGVRVHLALPKQSLFREEKQEPTASVVLDLSPSFSRSQQNIRGLVHLVASSVEGLSPEKVTVVDSRGGMLSSEYDDSTAVGTTSKQAEIIKAAEADMERKAESMLTTILGPGKAIVRVKASMNFDQVERTEEKYDPESATPRTETRTEETFSQKDNTATAQVETAASAGKSLDKSKEKTTTSYEINRSVERTVTSAGSLKKITIAVVVDGAYKAVEGAKGKKPTREYVPRTDAEKEMYKNLVMNAVGFDQARGDTITVSDAAFDNSYFEEQEKETKDEANGAFAMTAVKQGSTVIVILLILFFLLRLVRGFSALPLPGMGQLIPEGASFAMAGAAGGSAVDRAAAALEERKRKQEEEEAAMMDSPEFHLNLGKKHPRSIIENEMRDLVMQDPDTVAQLIRMWLDEDE
jgi:flagellar M-ring protein FliF